ncbi:MAG: LysR family transcriptional regulator [Gammaproteobacteria bacterium]|nr:LysR family transcriptional regulator [Gammaproteobacteria bacterium]
MHPRDLNLRHLRGFLEVCDKGSVSAAAAALGTSQPALTQAIAKLEQQLQHRLFERRSRGLMLTAAGEVAAVRVRAALDDLADGVKAVSGKSLAPERRLSLAQAHAFLALVERGSFAAAGTSTGMAAASIHRAVRDLEDVVGRPMAERHGRTVAITLQGRRFARSCRLAFAELEAAFADLGTRGGAAVIVVGTTPLARAFLVPEAMATMSARAEDVGFRVLEGSWGELAEALRDGLVDIVVGEAPPEAHSELEVQQLYESAIVVAAGQQHPLVGRRPSLARLAAFPWIVMPQDSPLRDAWQRIFAKTAVQTPIECGSIMIIGRLLTSRNLLTLATPDQVALQIRSGLLARIDALPREKIAIGTTMRRGWRPPVAHAQFLAHLAEAAAQMRGKPVRRTLAEKRWV